MVLLDKAATLSDKYAALAIELGHIFCGHLGIDGNAWWPERQGLNIIQEEIEANSVAYLTCQNKGLEAAELLLEKQWEGIRAAAEAGLVVKVNTVLLPDINMDEIEDIAKKAAEYGAVIMNIIPLIPLYDFEGSEPPTCEDLNLVRTLAGEYLPQFRLCQQCRADAVGVPGEEPCGSPIQKAAQGEYYHG